VKIIQTSGKRKRAIARATVRPGTGVIRINGVPIEKLTHMMKNLKLSILMLKLKAAEI